MHNIANILNHTNQIQNENLNDRRYNEESTIILNKKSLNNENLNANSNQNLNNKFILNQMNQEKQSSKFSKKESKKTPQNQIFYNDVYNGSFNDLPNIDRNALVNSTLSTYNVYIVLK